MRTAVGPVAVLVALALALAPASAFAQAPVFNWVSPQPNAQGVPAGSFILLTRFARGEALQRFYVNLAAGATETLQVLAPAGALPPEVTVLAPDGSEFSLPSLPAAQRVWMGPIPLDRSVAYPYQAQAAGEYGMIVQAADPSVSTPYALAGNWQGTLALTPSDVGAFLWLPITWLRALIWRLG